MGETVAVTHLDGYGLGNSKTITSISTSTSFQYFNKNRPRPDIPTTHTHGLQPLQHNDNDKIEYSTTGASAQFLKNDNNSSHDSSSYSSSSSKTSKKKVELCQRVSTYTSLNKNGNTWSSSSSEEEPHGDQGDSSDYTDAKSTLSAPVELLSEFLSAVMARNYEIAHKLCQSILKFEPNNSTVKEFYPLITMRLHQGTNSNTEEEDTSTDEGNESEDTMDSCSSLGDEDDEEDELSCMTASNIEVNKNASKKHHSIYFGNFSSSGSSLYTTANSDLTSQSLSSGGSRDSETDTLGGITGSNSCELTIDSGDSLYSGDSVFSSTDSDLTLEAVIKATGDLNV